LKRVELVMTDDSALLINLEAITNLLYLCKIEAQDPSKVIQYSEMADEQVRMILKRVFAARQGTFPLRLGPTLDRT
jgi:hypothetical protein